MNIIISPSRDKWNELITRNIPDDDDDVMRAVMDIAQAVAAEGDNALRNFAKRFDNVDLNSLRVSDDEISQAAAAISPELRRAIDSAAENIARFHRMQLPAEINCETVAGVHCRQRAVAIDRVGLYIPGGRAPLFSTVLMLAIPAVIAGCREIALFTPRSATFGINPAILYAASHCGVTEIYQVGGAQAIAAMALGTQSIRRVDKIFGPGNRYVTKAKQLLSNKVSIDMPAGPSEVMVLADSSAVPSFVAADMLSQAEHGPDSQAMAVCATVETANAVLAEVERQRACLSRAESVAASLDKSKIIVIPDRNEMLEFANAYAAEHLIIALDSPWEAADRITAAGSIFIGNYSPESAGDYASGTNHTLPTSGWARSLNGVNIDSFMHKITYQQLTPDGLASLATTIVTMASAEGLDAHAKAVNVRLDNLSKSK